MFVHNQQGCQFNLAVAKTTIKSLKKILSYVSTCCTVACVWLQCRHVWKEADMATISSYSIVPVTYTGCRRSNNMRTSLRCNDVAVLNIIHHYRVEFECSPGSYHISAPGFQPTACVIVCTETGPKTRRHNFITIIFFGNMTRAPCILWCIQEICSPNFSV